MPRATVDTQATIKHDLSTLPEGYVVLRKLSYGEMLNRQDMATRQAMKGTNRQNAELTIEMMQSLVAEYEFKQAIVDHNLDDENGAKLNFSVPGTVNRLDPRVGAEIGQLIDDMNQFDAANLTKESDSPSLVSVSQVTTQKSDQ